MRAEIHPAYAVLVVLVGLALLCGLPATLYVWTIEMVVQTVLGACQ